MANNTSEVSARDEQAISVIEVEMPPYIHGVAPVARGIVTHTDRIPRCCCKAPAGRQHRRVGIACRDLFIDGGRVYDGLRGIEGRDLRLGYGGGFDYRTRDGPGVRASLSRSEDGIFFNFSFESLEAIDDST